MTLSPEEAFARAGRGTDAIGWKVDRAQRKELLQQFPPRYEEVVADHVTLAGKAADEAELPGDVTAEIIGRADDGQGVEAMVVRLEGTSDRPDGSTYHITWSLAEGRHAIESNDVIAAHGWRDFELPMPVRLHPARFP
jgi:hypothetical protein